MFEKLFEVLILIAITVYIFFMGYVMYMVHPNSKVEVVQKPCNISQVEQPKKIETAEDYLDNLLNFDGGEVKSSRYYME